MDSYARITPWNLLPKGLAWRRLKLLGHGSYGAVYLAFFTNFTNLEKLLAVKTTYLELHTSLYKEKRILDDLGDCPEIVGHFGHNITIEKGIKLYNLYLEYAPLGTLSDLTRRSEGCRLPETNVKIYTKMILKGLCCMHARGYVHCDLKPDNILVFPSVQGGHCRVKIADFGLAKEPCEEIFPDDYKGKFRGTPFYMSPDSVVFGEIGPALDIWSLGCVVVEMITGKRVWHAFEGSGIDFAFVLASTAPQIPQAMTDTGKDFLRKCFAIRPGMRWTAAMLLNHPYVNVCQ